MLPSGVRAIVRKFTPYALRVLVNELRELPEAINTACYRHRIVSGVKTNQTEQLLDYKVSINDGPNFYAQYKDIVGARIYHFESRRQDPFILDCGSNIGGGILYYKHIYPKARIIGFEPDPSIFPYLQKNVSSNALQDVKLLQAALSAKEGYLTFYSDGQAGSCVGGNRPSDKSSEHWTRYDVPCLRLRDFLTEPVDFLKMNIEGAEWEVLQDSEDLLRNVEEIVLEYHHWPGLPRTLHKILALLDRQGFEYLINHFDYETNPGLKPPFKLNAESRYFLLVYAKKMP